MNRDSGTPERDKMHVACVCRSLCGSKLQPKTPSTEKSCHLPSYQNNDRPQGRIEDLKLSPQSPNISTVRTIEKGIDVFHGLPGFAHVEERPGSCCLTGPSQAQYLRKQANSDINSYRLSTALSVPSCKLYIPEKLAELP